MPAVRSNFGDLLTPGFRKIYFDAYDEVPSVMEKIFTMNSSSKDSERDSSVTGFGYPTATPEDH